MRETSEAYKRILNGQHVKEYQISIGGELYSADKIDSANARRAIFTDAPAVGKCISGEINIKLRNVASSDIPRGAMIVPSMRLVSTKTGEASPWLRKGVYYLYERFEDPYSAILTLHGYDALLKAEQTFTIAGDQGRWPLTDLEAATEIAAAITPFGLSSKTQELLNQGYYVQYPGYGEGAYTMREVLGYIGAMYAGNWIINDVGALELVLLGAMPPDVDLLGDEQGNALLFGGDSILVG